MVLYNDLTDYRDKIKERLIDTEKKIELIVDELKNENILWDKIKEYITDRNVSGINKIFTTIETKNNTLYEKITNDLSVKFPIEYKTKNKTKTKIKTKAEEEKEDKEKNKILQFIEILFDLLVMFLLDDTRTKNLYDESLIATKSVDGLKVFVCVEFPKNKDNKFYTEDIKTDVIGFIVNPEDEYNYEYENPVVTVDISHPYFKDILNDIVTKMNIIESTTTGGKSRKKQTRINKNRSKKIYLKK